MAIIECGVCFKGLFKRPKDWERMAVRCANCGGLFCVSHIRSYVDGSNEAITKNSPKYCINCFYLFHDHNGERLSKPRTLADRADELEGESVRPIGYELDRNDPRYWQYRRMRLERGHDLTVYWNLDIVIPTLILNFIENYARGSVPAGVEDEEYRRDIDCIEKGCRAVLDNPEAARIEEWERAKALLPKYLDTFWW